MTNLWEFAIIKKNGGKNPPVPPNHRESPNLGVSLKNDFHIRFQNSEVLKKFNKFYNDKKFKSSNEALNFLVSFALDNYYKNSVSLDSVNRKLNILNSKINEINNNSLFNYFLTLSLYNIKTNEISKITPSETLLNKGYYITELPEEIKNKIDEMKNEINFIDDISFLTGDNNEN